MAKVTANYEALYIIEPNLGEEGTAALVAKFKDLVEANGALTELNEWGARRLAYPINDINDGYYVLMYFSAPAELPAELERNYKISDDVMRFIVINLDKE